MNIQKLAGQTLGNYKLLELIGEGGMGAVYRALQISLHREVAVKVLSPELAQQAGHSARFIREAQTSARLEHRHIIPVYDYGTENDISYVVMRLLAGGTLLERLERHIDKGDPLPSLDEIAEMLAQLASALDYAHRHDVIHRDIKPTNIMFDDQNTTYIVDFGIAKLLTTEQTLTRTGVRMGTPTHMAPEQWRSEKVEAATDQYALGIMTYSMVTGRVPFEAVTPYALMNKHINETPTPPRMFRPNVPSELENVLARAIAKKPGDRFPTCTAFAEAFSSAASSTRENKTGFFRQPTPSDQPAPRPAEPSQPIPREAGPRQTTPPGSISRPSRPEGLAGQQPTSTRRETTPPGHFAPLTRPAQPDTNCQQPAPQPVPFYKTRAASGPPPTWSWCSVGDRRCGGWWPFSGGTTRAAQGMVRRTPHRQYGQRRTTHADDSARGDRPPLISQPSAARSISATFEADATLARRSEYESDCWAIIPP
jgi:serine/threonine-protein kinase